MSPEDQDVRAEVVARDRPTNAPTQVTRDQVRRALRHITWTGAATLLGRLEQLYEQVIDEAIEATRSYLAELGAKAVIEDLQISTSMAVKDRRPPRAVQTNPAEMTLVLRTGSRVVTRRARLAVARDSLMNADGERGACAGLAQAGARGASAARLCQHTTSVTRH